MYNRYFFPRSKPTSVKILFGYFKTKLALHLFGDLSTHFLPTCDLSMQKIKDLQNRKVKKVENKKINSVLIYIFFQIYYKHVYRLN